MEVSSIIPNAEHMSQVFAQAAAPAFFLGACVALGSLLMSRLMDVMHLLRNTATQKGSKPSDYLLKRARLLHSAIKYALSGALCTTLLLMISFTASLLRLDHVYGASTLFVLATIMVGCSLFRFAQEIRVGLVELEEYL